ncbi:MAG: zinc ribbon domain-containing protein [Lachnospiraceae bacterium]|nr:zinc ribbon domain-containing protein [Lachnospiraceae bacterium]
MEFFNKLGETITEKSREVAQKTMDITEISRLKKEIDVQWKNLDETFETIGRKCYEANKNQEDHPYARLFRKAEEISDRIEKMQKEFYDLKGVKICQNCGEENPKEAAFCAECGNELKII